MPHLYPSTRAAVLAALGLVAAALCLTAPEAAHAQPFTISSTAGTDGAGRPTSVAIGDLDGDGYLDLVTANSFGNSVSLLTNNGSGGYALTSNITVGTDPRSVAVADLDGDGDLDITTANNGDGSVSVLLKNNAPATGYTLSTVLIGTNPFSIAVGDLDGDGDLDLVTANPGDNSVGVLLKNDAPATGYTVSIVASFGASPRGVAVGDLDSDGDLDIATANQQGNSVSVLLKNNGAPDYAVSIFPVPGDFSSGPYSIAVGDLDGDGDLDLATANQSDNAVGVLTNDGSGSYTGSIAGSFSGGNGDAPISVAVGDLNGDGRLDIVTANQLADRVGVLLKNAGAGYTTSTVSTFNGGFGIKPFGVAVGDLDGDGDLDLVTANNSSRTIGVLRNDRAGTEPSAPSASSSSTPNSVTVGYTAPADANNVLIVRSLASDPAPTPTDNTEYELTNVLISGIVVAIRNPGAGNSGVFTDNAVSPGVAYRYSVFGFTGSAPQTAGPRATTGISPDFGPAATTFAVAADAPLPVELSTFTGSGKNAEVALSWSTASETDNAGFIVLQNGVEIASYRSLASLRGKGTTANRSAYGYTDARVQPGASYSYTLRSVDVSGSVHDYARSVAVTVEAIAVAPQAFRLLSAAPNPFNPSTTIRFDLPAAATVQATLFDALGRSVRTVTGQFSAGANQALALDASGLPSGAYLVRLTAGTHTATVRVMLAK